MTTRTPTGQDLVCLVCHKGSNIDIDHVVNRGMGGSKARDVPENKVPLCRECHTAKTNGVLETYVAVDLELDDTGQLNYFWRRGKVGEVPWIAVPVEVSQRYKCLVGRLSDAAEAAVNSGAHAEQENTSGSSASSLKEESEPVLSAAAEAAEETPSRESHAFTSTQPASVAAPSPGLTHDQRVAIAAEIKDAQERRGWRVGDTANEWEEELGEDFWNLYANDFGYTYPSLRNHQRVSRQIPQELRNPHLSHSHHVIVAGLSRLSVVLWLYRCEIEEWSVKAFREAVKGTKPKVRRWTLEELREDFGAWLRDPSSPAVLHVAEFLDWLGEQR